MVERARSIWSAWAWLLASALGVLGELGNDLPVLSLPVIGSVAAGFWSSVIPQAAQFGSDMEAYIDQYGLSKYRGRIVPRNSHTSSWLSVLDLRLSQDSLRVLADENETLLIWDEVQTGIGRALENFVRHGHFAAVVRRRHP